MQLEGTIRKYMHSDVPKRYMRIEEAAEMIGVSEEDVVEIALAAGARYQLPKITLIYKERMVDYMKHLCKVPGTSKIVQKKFVRIGEGSITYSIGHHRFIEMARAAGAVYKIGEGKGGQVLINLEAFDDYLEQFREPVVEMKHPLWKPEQ